MSFNINYKLSKQEINRIAQVNAKDKISALSKQILAGEDPVEASKQVFQSTEFYNDIHGIAIMLATPPSFIFKEMEYVSNIIIEIEANKIKKLLEDSREVSQKEIDDLNDRYKKLLENINE